MRPKVLCNVWLLSPFDQYTMRIEPIICRHEFLVQATIEELLVQCLCCYHEIRRDAIFKQREGLDASVGNTALDCIFSWRSSRWCDVIFVGDAICCWRLSAQYNEICLSRGMLTRMASIFSPLYYRPAYRLTMIGIEKCYFTWHVLKD